MPGPHPPFRLAGTPAAGDTAFQAVRLQARPLDKPRQYGFAGHGLEPGLNQDFGTRRQIDVDPAARMVRVRPAVRACTCVRAVSAPARFTGLRLGEVTTTGAIALGLLAAGAKLCNCAGSGAPSAPAGMNQMQFRV